MVAAAICPFTLFEPSLNLFSHCQWISNVKFPSSDLRVMGSHLFSRQVFLVTVWNFELYMIPLALLLIFLYNFLRPMKGKASSAQDSQVSKDSRSSSNSMLRTKITAGHTCPWLSHAPIYCLRHEEWDTSIVSRRVILSHVFWNLPFLGTHSSTSQLMLSIWEELSGFWLSFPP